MWKYVVIKIIDHFEKYIYFKKIGWRILSNTFCLFCSRFHSSNQHKTKISMIVAWNNEFLLALKFR